MYNSKTAIAVLITLTTSFAACSRNDKETNDDRQDDKENAATTIRDSLMDSPEQVSADFTLLPGIAAGKIKIDGNTEEVFELLGKPDSSDAAMQKMVAFWFQEQDGVRHSTSIFAARTTEELSPSRVRQIRVTSPAFKTKEGFGVNDTLMEIKKAYDVQHIKYPLTPNQIIQVWNDKDGIAFEIGDDQRCKAVIIFKKGDDPTSTYLPLR
ncbi:hypothetical protein IWX76_000410 [Pedobacter sp. CAN_A7]|uniref:hypothetical protein n=1 Tax=Pedobacter sp. CAN_A7 TaxID=2787722 RepID=UPI0018C91641